MIVLYVGILMKITTILVHAIYAIMYLVDSTIDLIVTQSPTPMCNFLFDVHCSNIVSLT